MAEAQLPTLSNSIASLREGSRPPGDTLTSFFLSFFYFLLLIPCEGGSDESDLLLLDVGHSTLNKFVIPNLVRDQRTETSKFDRRLQNWREI